MDAFAAKFGVRHEIAFTSPFAKKKLEKELPEMEEEMSDAEILLDLGKAYLKIALLGLELKGLLTSARRPTLEEELQKRVDEELLSPL